MLEKWIIGVDIGGTWIRVACCPLDLENNRIESKKIENTKENKFSISNGVCKLISELLVELSIPTEQIMGIGLATAGPINMETGEVFNNANLGFRVVPLKKPISKKFPGIPIYMINDCNAAVLGVHFFEAKEQEKDNLVYVTMSTGIGGGVICNGHLVLGKEGNAAEIGHGLVEPNSKFKCNCGAHGCWEVFSSGTGVRNRALDGLEKGGLNSGILMELVNQCKESITAKEIFQAARKGDELSLKIVNQCVFYTKVGIGLINNFYDCSSIYFGGAMMKDEDLIIPPIKEQLENNPVEFTINHPPEIKVTQHGDEIGLRGALALAKYKLEKNPIVPL